MNTITITFTHTDAVSPKYKFGDRIAVIDETEPENWATGKVVGLQLEELFEPRWLYLVKLDLPSGFTEEYLDTDLVPESEILTQEAKCVVAAEPDVDDSLPEWAESYANWHDYVLAEMPEAINPDLTFDG